MSSIFLKWLFIFPTALIQPTPPALDPVAIWDMYAEWRAQRLATGGEGACCVGGGCLENLDQRFCEEVLGGIYAGDGSDCDEGACEPGACCLPTGECSEGIEVQCADLGGEFQGIGSDCDSTECPQPAGACCIEGDCVPDQEEDDCRGAGGEWAGPETPCDENLCTRGACCIESTCVPAQREGNCIGAGGRWAGLFTSCKDDPCRCLGGDLHVDDNVDLRDSLILQACFGEEGVRECFCSDLDGDGLVQLEDFALFYDAMTGPRCDDSDCDDGDACTTDTCIDGVCTNEAVDCDDDDACTTDTCTDGVCANEAVDCDDGDACTADTCDSDTGDCSNEPLCDDGLFCNGVDTCDSNGNCVAGDDPCESLDCGNDAPICVEGDTSAEFIRSKKVDLFSNDTRIIAAQLCAWVRQRESAVTVPCSPPEVRAGSSCDDQNAKSETFLEQELLRAAG